MADDCPQRKSQSNRADPSAGLRRGLELGTRRDKGGAFQLLRQTPLLVTQGRVVGGGRPTAPSGMPERPGCVSKLGCVGIEPGAQGGHKVGLSSYYGKPLSW